MNGRYCCYIQETVTCDGNCPLCYNNRTVKIGEHELDPHLYEEVETVQATVHVLKCKRCGHMDWSWERGV